MRSNEFLQAAIDVQTARAAEYDQPGGERSMGRTVQAFNTITGRDLTEAEGWLLLQVLKDVRQWSAKGYHHDSALDGVAYSALKAEALHGEQKTDTPSALPRVEFPVQWLPGDLVRGNRGAEYTFVGLAGRYADVIREGLADKVLLEGLTWVGRAPAAVPGACPGTPWMPYTGGPVPDLDWVEITTACGDVASGPASKFIWGGHGTKGRITHYREAIKP